MSRIAQILAESLTNTEMQLLQAAGHRQSLLGGPEFGVLVRLRLVEIDPADGTHILTRLGREVLCVSQSILTANDNFASPKSGTN